jgi:hypothetical protein
MLAAFGAVDYQQSDIVSRGAGFGAARAMLVGWATSRRCSGVPGVGSWISAAGVRPISTVPALPDTLLVNASPFGHGQTGGAGQVAR